VINVFIVDDHHVVRAGLQMMLRDESDMHVAGTAGSAAEALRQLVDLQVDVLLTDLRMPEVSGDKLLLEVHRLEPGLRTLVLTNYHSDEDAFRAVRAGAMGYVLKSATMEEIFDTIRRVHRGERCIPNHIAEQVMLRVSRIQLSPRESEILQLIARGMRNREVGKQLFISENTVRNHLLNIFEKLGTKSRTEAVAMAIQQGLVRFDQT